LLELELELEPPAFEPSKDEQLTRTLTDLAWRMLVTWALELDELPPFGPLLFDELDEEEDEDEDDSALLKMKPDKP
jgi:hypothetical protein